MMPTGRPAGVVFEICTARAPGPHRAEYRPSLQAPRQLRTTVTELAEARSGQSPARPDARRRTNPNL